MASKSASEKMAEFLKNYNSASKETKQLIKDSLQADTAANLFFKNWRSANENTRQEIVKKLVSGDENTAAQFNSVMSNVVSNAAANAKANQTPVAEVEYEDTTEDTIAPSVTPVNPADDFKTEEAIRYTYKPGDTFGQVLLNLGLSNGKNLWGPNGDVAYYTKQLNDQGIKGNIPIGKTISLLPRGTREKLQANRNQYSGNGRTAYNLSDGKGIISIDKNLLNK